MIASAFGSRACVPFRLLPPNLTPPSMPSSARKSSIGQNRRDSLKNHVPYRGDDPGVGKKTGISVRPVRRKSDGFERFEDVMSQADVRTPPQVKGRKKQRIAVSPIDEEDDIDDADRTQDMDLDSQYLYTCNIRSRRLLKLALVYRPY